LARSGSISRRRRRIAAQRSLYNIIYTRAAAGPGWACCRGLQLIYTPFRYDILKAVFKKPSFHPHRRSLCPSARPPPNYWDEKFPVNLYRSRRPAPKAARHPLGARDEINARLGRRKNL